MGHKRLDHVYSPVQIIRAAPAGRPSLENHLMQLAEPGKFKHILYCFCTACNYFYASKAKGFRKQSKARFRLHRDRKSKHLNSSHLCASRMLASARKKKK